MEDFETWHQMKARHRAERKAAVERLAAARLTKTQAAHILGTNLSQLSNFTLRENIHWPVRRQGRPSHLGANQ